MSEQLPQTPAELSDLGPMKITVAPNGARRGVVDHPKLPITLAEIIETATDCAAAGADEIHLHVRDPNGRHSLDVGLYRETIAEIAKVTPHLDVQVTTEAAGIFSVEEQLFTLQSLRPAAASIAVREMARDLQLAARAYGLCRDAATSVQHILYDLKDLEQLIRWQREGVVSRVGCSVLLVLGQYAPARLAMDSELAPFVTALEGHVDQWMVCAFGRNEQAVVEEAINLGGHVRVGFENNIERPDGSLLIDNAESVSRAAQAARAMGRPLLKETVDP